MGNLRCFGGIGFDGHGMPVRCNKPAAGTFVVADEHDEDTAMPLCHDHLEFATQATVEMGELLRVA